MEPPRDRQADQLRAQGGRGRRHRVRQRELRLGRAGLQAARRPRYPCSWSPSTRRRALGCAGVWASVSGLAAGRRRRPRVRGWGDLRVPAGTPPRCRRGQRRPRRVGSATEWSGVLAGRDRRRRAGRRLLQRPWQSASQQRCGDRSRHGCAARLRPEAHRQVWLEGTVDAMATRGDSVFAAGDFVRIGGRRRRSLAKLDATTGRVRRWDARVGSRGRARELAVSGRRLYVGGNLPQHRGTPAAQPGRPRHAYRPGHELARRRQRPRARARRRRPHALRRRRLHPRGRPCRPAQRRRRITFRSAAWISSIRSRRLSGGSCSEWR